jgi:Uma2 family endonuclease
MATTAHIPVEAYLRSDYQPDAEYIDGVIVERPVGEDDHSAWQEAICAWFRQHADTWNIRIRPELRVQVKSANFLVPDVAILNAALPRERIATHPPVAVFEVLSPENTNREMQRKYGLYQAMGIPHIWIVNPENGRWQRYEEGSLTENTTFDHPTLGIHFDMKEIGKLVR